MIKLRFFVLALVLSFVLTGCLDIFHRPQAPLNKKMDPPAKNRSDDRPPAASLPEPGSAKNQTPAPAPQEKPTVSADVSTQSLKPSASVKPALPSPPKPFNNPETNAPPTEKKETISVSDLKPSLPAEKKAESPLTPKKIQSILDEALDFSQASQDFWQKGELDNAFEALDQAYSLILKIDHQDIKAELLQQKEDLRFLISKRILEIYASRNIVVNGAHDAIPLEINSHIQEEINLFTTGREKNFFIQSYKRAGRYRARIVAELEKAGLPTELSWLPLIESGFKVNALSRARALGLWQFIPSTGYKFGLKRNVFIDERLDPDKATQAAIAYLKELHQIFGDWTTVLAAYNCGEGRVLRVIRDQNVNYLDNFWDLYMRLPRETARYVPRFLATLHILKDPQKYGLDSIATDPPIEYEAVTISKQVHLKDVARSLGIAEKKLHALNPELRYKILPKEPYALKVPPGNGSILLAKIDSIQTSMRPRPAYVKHRVRRGETLSSIAQRYRTSVSRIARANNINKRNLIVAGKTLRIPTKGAFTYKKSAPVQKTYPHPATHVVKSGDSLWILAKRYSTTTKEIQGLNNLSGANLYIGQVLKIPGAETKIPHTDGLKTYRVRKGDSPFKIAKHHKMPLEQLLRINHLTPRSKIFPGQKLFVE